MSTVSGLLVSAAVARGAATVDVAPWEFHSSLWMSLQQTLIAAKNHGVEIPRDLWPPIIFATSGELTRRALLASGVPDYVPSSVDLFTRAWPRYREPVEKNWFPYLDGHGTLQDAIGHVVAAIPR